jgi:hypothetical protein
MDWAKILGDKTAYPDDAKISINGQDVTLGAIRTQNAASQGELERKLTERQTQQDQREQSQQAATDNLAKIVENVQRVTGLSVEQIVAGQIPENMRSTVQQATLATRTASGQTLADDPLYAPIIAEIAPLRQNLDFTRNALGQALNVYKSDRARLDFMEWDRFDKPAGDVKVTFDQAVQNAVTKGYKNTEGWPDVKRAAAELAGPAVAQHHEEELKTRYIEEGRRQAQAEMAARQGQPTFGMGDMPSATAASVDFSGKPAPAGAQVKTIREQLDHAFNDPKMFQTNAVQ